MDWQEKGRLQSNSGSCWPTGLMDVKKAFVASFMAAANILVSNIVVGLTSHQRGSGGCISICSFLFHV